MKFKTPSPQNHSKTFFQYFVIYNIINICHQYINMLPDVCKGDGQIMAPCHHMQMFNKPNSMLACKTALCHLIPLCLGMLYEGIIYCTAQLCSLQLTLF